MTTISTSEGGFVVLDALISVLVLSLAGTTLVATAVTLLQRERATLDRSVALVISQSLMRQYPLLGDQELADELYNYRASTRPYDSAPSMFLVDIKADPVAARDGDAEVMLSFLVADRNSAP